MACGCKTGMHDTNVKYVRNAPGVDAKLKNTKSIKMGPNCVATIKPIIVDTYNTFTFLDSNGIKAKQKNVRMDARWMRNPCIQPKECTKRSKETSVGLSVSKECKSTW